jgi:hypothetical protein
VTQHGSFPGRPRGRRARPYNDVPEWAGFDAVPEDQREFPDLAPIRGRDARARDGRVQEERVQEERGTGGNGHPSDGHPSDGYPSEGPGHASAKPGPVEAFSERWRRRGSASRGDRRADRRRRRRLLAAGGAAVAVVIAVVVYFVTGGGGSSANLGLGSLVTTFLPGELQQVPNACTSVPSATLGRYLPGQRKVAAPPLNSGANSQCTWTLDKPPLYRVLEVNIQAYSPSGLASGDGSATFAAIDAYAEAETAKQKPGPRSGQPKATVTDVSGMPGGRDSVAFQATQVFQNNGAVTDMVTVAVRYRNVIVTVVMNGLEHANTGNYGPVSPSQLSSAAQTVAQQVTGQLVH